MLSGQGAFLSNMFKYLDNLTALGITETPKIQRIIKHIKLHDEDTIKKRTELTQPAVVINAYLKFMKNRETIIGENGLDYILASSVGEFSALAISEMLPFEDVLDLVEFRGQLMAKFFKRIPGTTYIIVASPEVVSEKISQTPGKKFEISSIFSEKTCMLSGYAADCSKPFIKDLFKGIAIKGISFNYAFHHSMLKEIAPTLMEKLRSFSFQDPKIKFFSNATNEEFTKENAATLLCQQLYSPVLFADNAKRVIPEIEQCFDLDSEGFFSGILRNKEQNMKKIFLSVEN